MGDVPLVLAHDEIVDARAAIDAPSDAIVLAFQEVVEPGEAEVVDGTVGGGTDRLQARADRAVRPAPAQMLPRADDDPLVLPRQGRGAVSADAVEVAQAPVDEGVVPALEGQHRHRDLVVAGLDAEGLPIGVVGGMFDSVEEVGRDHRALRLQIGQLGVGREAEPGRLRLGRLLQRRLGRRVLAVDGRAGGDGVGHPAFDEGQPEFPVLIGPAVVVVGGGVGWDDGLQRGRRGGGGQPLGRAHVGRAIHADLAVGAGQAGGPFDAVVAVVPVIGVFVEDPVRGALAADVLDHHDVAVGGVPVRRLEARRLNLRRGLAVLGAHQDDRDRVLGRGPIDVGAQDDPVAHLGLDIGLFGHRTGPAPVSGRPIGEGGRRPPKLQDKAEDRIGRKPPNLL